MKQHNFWKRTAAGIMAVLLVFGSAPLTGMPEIFERTAIVASAIAETTVRENAVLAVPTVSGDTITIAANQYFKTTGADSPVKEESAISGKLIKNNNNTISLSYGEGTGAKTSVVANISVPTGMAFANSVTVKGSGADAATAYEFTPNYGYNLSNGQILATDSFVVPPTNSDVYVKPTTGSDFKLPSYAKFETNAATTPTQLKIGNEVVATLAEEENKKTFANTALISGTGKTGDAFVITPNYNYTSTALTSEVQLKPGDKVTYAASQGIVVDSYEKEWLDGTGTIEVQTNGALKYITKKDNTQYERVRTLSKTGNVWVVKFEDGTYTFKQTASTTDVEGNAILESDVLFTVSAGTTTYNYTKLYKG